jgi:hypothetical protein
MFIGRLRFTHNGLWWTNLNEYALDMINTIRLYTSFITIVFVCLFDICVALGFFAINVKIVKRFQSSFRPLFSLLFFHVCWMFLLHWGFVNSVGFSKVIALPLKWWNISSLSCFLVLSQILALNQWPMLDPTPTKELLVALLKT